jgi:hypothetical protein
MAKTPAEMNNAPKAKRLARTSTTKDAKINATNTNNIRKLTHPAPIPIVPAGHSTNEQFLWR